MQQQEQTRNSQTEQQFVNGLSVFSCRVLSLCEKEKDIRVLLNLLRLNEPDAYLHSLRVATMMDRCFCPSEDVLIGCLLHDIGKICTPFNLSLHPCPLTKCEREIVRLHTVIGSEILSCYNETILSCVSYHHDESCPIEYVQQLRACDIFDALIHDRPYRVACDEEQTKKILLKNQFNPQWINKIFAVHNEESEAFNGKTN